MRANILANWRGHLLTGAALLAIGLLLIGIGQQWATDEANGEPGAQTEPALQQGGADWPVLATDTMISGFNQPTHITHAGDGSGRLFVVEQPGRIRIVRDGAVLATPFLDITERVGCCGERGLLSVAFPPDYASNGAFYVNYTRTEDGATVVARFRLGSGPDEADPASEEILLQIDQPFPNHNGGQIAFGPDGYLYIGMGDGGSGGDPQNNGQGTDTLLGKLLRIDVEAATMPYAIPPTNPYTQTAGYRAEIWALGLRNPWRFSFDRATGDIYIADVGQGNYEEISRQPGSSPGGENYGWRCLEGANTFNTQPPCDAPDFVQGLVPPIHDYDHSDGSCSVTGGFVYRGTQYPRMQGIYFYADYCSAKIWGLRPISSTNPITWENRLLLETSFGRGLTTFGEDEAGNLYVADANQDAIFLLIDAEASTATATPTSTATPDVPAGTATPTPTSTATPDVPAGTATPTPTSQPRVRIFVPLVRRS